MESSKKVKLFEEFMASIIGDAVTFCERAGRTEISKGDIVKAIGVKGNCMNHSSIQRKG
jgi:histone H3/H4